MSADEPTKVKAARAKQKIVEKFPKEEGYRFSVVTRTKRSDWRCDDVLVTVKDVPFEMVEKEGVPTERTRALIKAVGILAASESSVAFYDGEYVADYSVTIELECED